MEIRFCLDCLLTDVVDVHGRCGTCGSEAVAFPMHVKEFLRFRNEGVAECERIFALEGKK